jgi:hypothetical protein
MISQSLDYIEYTESKVILTLVLSLKTIQKRSRTIKVLGPWETHVIRNIDWHSQGMPSHSNYTILMNVQKPVNATCPIESAHAWFIISRIHIQLFSNNQPEHMNAQVMTCSA